MTDYQYGENPLDRIMTERRFTAAVAALQALIPREFSMEGKFELIMERLAESAVIAADALLAALEEKK